MKLFRSILIANRGEIAVRIIRAAQQSGISAIAVYAADDAGSLHVSMADKAVLIPGKSLNETYLNSELILKLALENKVDAIHPGYGFLSENAAFAQQITDAGMVFIGPSPENIRLMGEKNQALDFVKTLQIPVLPSAKGSVAELAAQAAELDYPVMVKASGGGGGKGMMICHSAGELQPALLKAERQALEYFGNGELFIEKYLPKARHIEVQIMADHSGNVLHFYERECSVQRRFQKIIEEAPSASVDEKLREEITSAAVKIAKAMHYLNAGTIEFLLDESGRFYFLEMNTRIQVEHPVTEMITQTDLVSMQIRVAEGHPLPICQTDIKISGHAIETRLCAEDAANNFKPSAGRLELWRIPIPENFRLETFVQEGVSISSNYDSLIAKCIVWDENRDLAIRKMNQVLSDAIISGVSTNQSFLAGLIAGEAFRKNEIYTRTIDENLESINQQIQAKREQINKHKPLIAYLMYHVFSGNNSGNRVWNGIGFWRINPEFELELEGQNYTCRLSGKDFFRIGSKQYEVSGVFRNGNELKLKIDQEEELFYCIEKQTHTVILYKGYSFTVGSKLMLNLASVPNKKLTSEHVFQNLICADLFGKVLYLNCRQGETVKAGQVLLTLESMKTEIHVLCPVDAMVKKVNVSIGEKVVEGQLLVELQPPPTLPSVEGE